ncbi:MAG: class I SAM-dependent methyltransferase [Acholeplasmatales bacterium]|nr:MAG: class I SAM-dependent methyltransferase [Acholeplasmatales bacterium]
MSDAPLSMTECVVCQGATQSLLDSQIRRGVTFVTYHVCLRCGFTMKDATAFPSPDEEKTQYDYHENTPDNTGYVAMFERFITHAIEPFVAPTRVLDYGSGPGPVLLDCLRRVGFDGVGYDPFYQPDTSVLKTRYPLIVSTEVFEHFHDPMATLEAIDRLLEVGGHLAVMTRLRPASDQAFLDWWYRRDSTHVAFYTMAAFDYIAKQFHWHLLHSDGQSCFTFQKQG